MIVKRTRYSETGVIIKTVTRAISFYVKIDREFFGNNSEIKFKVSDRRGRELTVISEKGRDFFANVCKKLRE